MDHPNIPNRPNICSFLHRSSDNGATWTTRRIDWRDVQGTPPPAKLKSPFINSWTVTSRNLLELADGSLVLGVSSWTGISYLWRSRDGGKSWDKSLACKFEGKDGEALPKFFRQGANGGFPRMDEAMFRQARNGDLFGIFRVDSRIFHAIPGTTIPTEDSDHFTRMLVFRSKDRGRNWRIDKELGSYYGEMYPSFFQLKDRRLLLTFTVRSSPFLQQHRPRAARSSAARCTSSSVEYRPTLSRTAPRPRAGGTPMACKTGDRVTCPS